MLEKYKTIAYKYWTLTGVTLRFIADLSVGDGPVGLLIFIGAVRVKVLFGICSIEVISKIIIE